VDASDATVHSAAIKAYKGSCQSTASSSPTSPTPCEARGALEGAQSAGLCLSQLLGLGTCKAPTLAKPQCPP